MREGDMVRHTKTNNEGWLREIRDVSGERKRHDETAYWGENPEFDDSWDCLVQWEYGSRDQARAEDLEVITPFVYVNVYLTDRCYGGPEEGGWWYDCKVVQEVLRCKDEAHAKIVYERKLEEYKEENRNRRSDISSVLSEGRFDVTLQAWPGERQPAERPHYC